MAAKVRPANLPWWQGASPVCRTGTLKRRGLSWGALYWCAESGRRVDTSLQNDLGLLARCMHESISAFQEEPEGGKLGAFLAKAHEAGLNPVLCGAVRRDRDVRTYHGRTVLLERKLVSSDAKEDTVRYRFSCEDCAVAAEILVEVAKGSR